MNEFYIRNVVEAALLAAGKSLQLAELGQLFDEATRPKVEDLQAGLAALATEYANRGLEVKETAAGFRIQVRKEFAGEISRLWPERPAKYSRALLETLALIAYRQPITRAEIEQVRGVAVNPNIVKTVIERNWVRVVGHRDVPGRPELLGTTREFLDYFGLRSLDELPALADVKVLGDYNLQLELPNAGAIGVDGKLEGGEGAPVAGLLTDGSAGEGAAEGVTGVEGEAAAEGLTVADGEVTALEGAVAEGVAVADGEGTVLEGAVADGEATALEGAVAEGVAVADGEATALEDAVAEGVAVAEGEAIALEGADAEGEALAVEGAAADSASGETAPGEVALSGEVATAEDADAVAQVETVEVESVMAEGGDAEAHRTLTADREPQHTAESDESEISESSAAGESPETLDEASEDDDEDELSADGHGSRELVAAPRDNDE